MNQKKDQVAPSQFVGVAICMGWQLAVVVLLPLIGGYKLDAQFGSMPLWTVIGLIIAGVGSVLIVRRAVQSMGGFYIPPQDKHDV